MGLFEGQVAWVTGAGRGIGRAVALALAEQGAAVALVSRTQNEVEQVAGEIRSRGGTAIASLLDVSNWDMVNGTAQQIEAALGPIDILINNAGVLEPLGKLWETDPEQAGRLFDINLSGAYYCLRAALPGMVKRGRGVDRQREFGRGDNGGTGLERLCGVQGRAGSAHARCGARFEGYSGARVLAVSRHCGNEDAGDPACRHARSAATRSPAVFRRSERDGQGAAAGSAGARDGVVVLDAL